MRILVLANKLPFPPRDGGSIATLNMLTGLRDAGNQVPCLSIITSKHAFPVADIPGEYSDSIRFLGIRRNTIASTTIKRPTTKAPSGRSHTTNNIDQTSNQFFVR